LQQFWPTFGEPLGYARWQNRNTDKQAKVQAQGNEHKGPKMISSGVTLQLKDTSSNEKNFSPWL
jgi:hypothetical protein